MKANGIICIHYRSELNTWIDFMLHVPEAEEEMALAAIRKGMDAFHQEGNQQPYGDCIAEALAATDILYLMECCPVDEETDEPRSFWTDLVVETENSKDVKVIYITE